ncbi:twin-arginine translocation signal domain-containing protein [Halolamina rubra]|uniref:twin-arginine translocation signal domain-containing protein n=1 Tax=Halolamina rubra TaxID=1380430 RepID=UPI0009E2DE3F|nr:twin-arginine translocation signal domain-containing protein [Halolamina rubra]
MNDDTRLSRRDALKAGTAVGLGAALAGCTLPGNGDGADGPLLTESFEEGLDGWETAAHIGPEAELSDFEWAIERSETQAADGDWSLEVFTEGDHDDGTAWATTELSPGDADSFQVTFQAWSQSESFNTLRNVVASLGPEAPEGENDFPDPGQNSTNVDGAPYGGLREPLHLAEGWREYRFTWEPASVPETLFLSLGVTVVWEADATHYLDSVRVEPL